MKETMTIIALAVATLVAAAVLGLVTVTAAIKVMERYE